MMHRRSRSSIPESSGRRFNRQFILGPSQPEGMGDWRRADVAHDYQLTSHPNLNTTLCHGRRAKLLCLGDVYDAIDPDLENQAIVERIAQNSKSFDEFERYANTLSGRWMFLVEIDDELRLYPDTTGQRPIFYTDAPGELWVGSQPLLLAQELGLRVDQDRTSTFFAHPHGVSWPGLVTPYRKIAQLWPNHYLDLRSGQSHRFWPVSPIKPQSLEEGARILVELLSKIIRGMAQRSKLNLWLTGGYDSRVLFAVSRALHAEMSFSVFNNYKCASFDTTISRALVRKSNRSIDVVRLKRANRTFWDLLRTNTASMSLEPGNVTKTAFEGFATDQLYLTGSIGEIGRCFYYGKGTTRPDVNPESLCRIAYYEGNAVALDVFHKWLAGVRETVPPEFGIDELDLFYWEHRLGTWLAMQSLGNDTFIDTISPFNCRAVLETMLGVDVENRKEPYLLFREICEQAFPEVLSEPFNWSRRWQLEQRLGSIVPWRIHDALDRLRKRFYRVEEVAPGG